MRKGTLKERRAPLFLPIEAAGTPGLPHQPERNDPIPARQIEIELSVGCRNRMDDGVSLPALRRMLTALRE